MLSCQIRVSPQIILIKSILCRLDREDIPRGSWPMQSSLCSDGALTSAVAVMLVYFFSHHLSGLVSLIPKIGVLGVVNAMSLIMITARLWDAVVDPVIAWFSDKKPAQAGATYLVHAHLPPSDPGDLFLPVPPATRMESQANIWYLVFIQVLFRTVGLYLYIIPYNAMLPELGHSSILKLRLATYQQLGFIIGWILAASCPALVDYFKINGMEPFRAYQYAIWIVFSMVVYSWYFLPSSSTKNVIAMAYPPATACSAT